MSSITATAQQRPAPSWRQTLEDRLPYYGHRNWIVVADSAYPLQSGIGIETILSNEDQLETVQHVLNVLSRAKHVRPVVYTDQELSFVPESEAFGISTYRHLLTGLFAQQKVATLPHEEIIHKLEDAAKSFHVLIIKSNMTLPYTSVFFELRAAYWSDEAEQRLRQAMPH
ncbi:MAG: hypothetical protein ABSB15_26975 [Bryobacteraceae bacterium]|jgi:D-ribose pyranose/furanose isomerase RbsD